MLMTFCLSSHAKCAVCRNIRSLRSRPLLDNKRWHSWWLLMIGLRRAPITGTRTLMTFSPLVLSHSPMLGPTVLQKLPLGLCAGAGLNDTNELLRQLFPQRPSQNLPHIRLRQFLPEVHALRHLVPGERLPAVINQFLLGKRLVLLHHKQSDDLA